MERKFGESPRIGVLPDACGKHLSTSRGAPLQVCLELLGEQHTHALW